MYVTEYSVEDQSRLKEDLERMRNIKHRHFLKFELLKQGASRLHRYLAVKRSVKWYVCHIFYIEKTVCSRMICCFFLIKIFLCVYVLPFQHFAVDVKKNFPFLSDPSRNNLNPN